MTNKKTEFNQIKAIIRDIGDWLTEDIDIKPKTSLANELGFDSFAIIRLQVAIEGCYCFRFDPVQTNFVQVFDKVENIVAYVQDMKVLQ